MKGEVPIRDHPEVAQCILKVADDICAVTEGRSRWDTAASLIWGVLVPTAWGGTHDGRGVLLPPQQFIYSRIASLLSCPLGVEIEIPVLEMGLRDQFEFGGIRFSRLAPESLKDDPVASWVYGVFDGRLTSMATLLVRGDESTVFQDVLIRVDEVLRVLSGMCWTILSVTPLLERWPFGARGEPVLPSAVGGGLDPGLPPFRQAGGSHFSGSFGRLHSTGPMPVFPEDVDRIWGEACVARLSRVYSRPDGATATELRLLTCLRWLGESLKPDIPAARTVKLAAALEGLVGRPTKGSRGDSAGVRKRLAKLATPDPQRQREIARLLEDLYSRRDDVMHRGELGVRAPHLSCGKALFDACLTVSAHLDCCSTLESLSKHCGLS